MTILIPALALTLQLTPWIAPCVPTAQTCGIPQAAGAPQMLSIKTQGPVEAGEVASGMQEFQSGKIAGRVSVFAVGPKSEDSTPPYIQLKIEITSPVRAACAQSVRYREPMELPPLICAAATTDQEFGVTTVLKNGSN